MTHTPDQPGSEAVLRDLDALDAMVQRSDRPGSTAIIYSPEQLAPAAAGFLRTHAATIRAALTRPGEAGAGGELERMVLAFGDVQFQRGRAYALAANGGSQEAFTKSAVRGDRAQAELVAAIRRLATTDSAQQASDAADLLSKESCLLVNGQPRFRTMPDGATLQDYLDKLCIGMLTPVDQMALDNMLHDRIATTDSVIQSQQGATGGAVGEVRIQDGCIVSTSIQRPLADGGYDIVPQTDHPQAAGSASGEATVAEVPCSTHPDAPHGFDRNGSHNAGRYVCDCEGWTPSDAGSAPVGVEPDGYTCYGEFRWACDADERMRKEWTPLWTAATPAVSVGGAP